MNGNKEWEGGVHEQTKTAFGKRILLTAAIIQSYPKGQGHQKVDGCGKVLTPHYDFLC